MLRLRIVEHAVEQRGQHLADARAAAPSAWRSEPVTARSPRASGSPRSRDRAARRSPTAPRRLSQQRMQREEIVRRAAHRGEPSAHRARRRSRPAPPVRAPSPPPARSRRSTPGGGGARRRSHRREARSSSTGSRRSSGTRAGCAPDAGWHRLQLGHPVSPPRRDSSQSLTSSGTVRAVRSPLNHSSRTRSAESCASPRRRLDGRRPGRRFDREPEPRGEPEAAQNAQVVLAEPLAPDRPRRGRTRRSRSARPPNGSRHSWRSGMVRDGVDGEVAAGEIVVERDAIARPPHGARRWRRRGETW